MNACKYACICCARLGNLAGYITGLWLHNGMTDYTTGRPDGIPESSPVQLVNWLTTPI